MGIFSNRCEALVDPVTGHALTGAALKAARQEPSWPRCGRTVSKTAHFCACGAPAPGGWVKCPRCDEWVGNDSAFCWNCNAPLHPDTRAAISNGVWQRQPGVFAQRFEAEEIRTKDGTELQVQEGTAAILISGGAVEDVLDAGRFNVESAARKINWFGNPPNRSAVLVETGEVALPIEVKELPTKAPDGTGAAAGMPVDFYGEAILRFSGGKAAAVAFIENAMKGRRELTFVELTARIRTLMSGEVRDYCRRSTLEDLLTDAEGREGLRKEISRRLEDEFEATGLDLVRMSSAEFKSPAYRELEQKSGDLDARRRQEEYRLAAEDLGHQLELKRFRDEHAFRMAKEALDREHRIDEADRDRAWNQMLQERADADRREQRSHELKELELQREHEHRKQKLEDEWNARMQELGLDEAERRQRQKHRLEELKDEEEAFHRRQEEETRRFRDEEEDRAWKREMIRKARIEEAAEKSRRKAAEERAQAEKAEIEKLRHEQEVAEMSRRAAKAKLEGELDTKRTLSDFERNEKLKDMTAAADARKIEAKAALDIRRDAHEQDLVEGAGGIGLRQRKANENLREQQELLDRIAAAEARKDTLTAQMLRDHYRKRFIEETW